MKKTLIVIFLIIFGVSAGTYFSEFSKDSINNILGKKIFDTLKEKDDALNKADKEKKSIAKELIKSESDKTNASDNIVRSKMPSFKWKISSSDPNFIKKIKGKHNSIVELFEEKIKEKVGILNAEIFDKNRTLVTKNHELEKTKKELEKNKDDLELKNTELDAKIKAMQELETELKKRKEEEGKSKKIAEDWKNKFKSLKIKFDGNKLSVEFKSDILFDSGVHKLKNNGIKELNKLAPELVKNSKNFDIFVVGHTDDVPVKKGKYDSNWGLSTFRAISVVKHLTSKGLPPKSISASGYGEHRPLKDNKTVENRKKNRRVEIFLIPKIIKRKDKKEIEKSNIEKGNIE